MYHAINITHTIESGETAGNDNNTPQPIASMAKIVVSCTDGFRATVSKLEN